MKQLLWQIPFLNVVLNVDERFKYFFYLALQLTQRASLLYLFGCSMRQYGSFVTDYTWSLFMLPRYSYNTNASETTNLDEMQ